MEFRFSGFNVDGDLEDKAFKVTGAKNKRILYTKALEFCLKNSAKFEKEFSKMDRTKIKDLKK